jgi:hypothetical protein
VKAYKRKRREANPEKEKARFRKWYEANRDKVIERSGDYWLAHPEKRAARDKRYRQANPEKLRKNNRKQQQKYREAHPLIIRLRARLADALKGGLKSGSPIRDLGCSEKELKVHLEKQFQSGMTWENRGEWHIDHIRPLAIFDLDDREQFLVACHYTNLQPLWAIDNIRKGDRC